MKKKSHAISCYLRVVHEFTIRVHHYPERTTLEIPYNDLLKESYKRYWSDGHGIIIELCGYPKDVRVLLPFRCFSFMEVYQLTKQDIILNVIAARKCQYHVEKTTSILSSKNTSTAHNVMQLQIVIHAAGIFSSHAPEKMNANVVKCPKGGGSERDKRDKNTTLSIHKQVMMDFISPHVMPNCDNYDDDVINDTNSVTQQDGSEEYVPEETYMNGNDTSDNDALSNHKVPVEEAIASNVSYLSQLGNLK